MNLPNREEFEAVYKELEMSVPLNLVHLHRIFGQQFFELITICLVEAKYSMLPEEIEKARYAKKIV